MGLSTTLIKFFEKSVPRLGDTLGTRLGKILIRPITAPGRALSRIFSSRARSLAKASKRLNKINKARIINKSGRLGLFKKRVGSFVKTGLALAAAPLVVRGLRNLFGNPSSPINAKNNLPNFDNNLPYNNLGPGNPDSDGATQQALNNLAKENKNKSKNDVKSKLAEAEADLYASRKQVSKLSSIKTNTPDTLQRIYAKQKTTDGRLDAIIELLNRQNEITNDVKILGRVQAEQQQEEIKSRLTKASELYRSLMKLQQEQNTANADALNSVSKRFDLATSKGTRNIANSVNKVAQSVKSSSLLKWALFGGLLYGVHNLISRLTGVGELISHGVDIISSGLHNIGEFLGIVHESQVETANSDSNQFKESELSKDVKDRSKEFKDKQEKSAKTLSAAVDQKTLDKITNPDGSINTEKAAELGISTNYDGTFDRKAGRLAGITHAGIAGYHAIKFGFGLKKVYKEERLAKEAAEKKAAEEKAKEEKAKKESKEKDKKSKKKERGGKKAKADKLAKTEKAATEVKDAKTTVEATKNTSRWSRFLNRTKSIANTVGKWTRINLVVDKTKKLWAAGKNLVSKTTWKVISKIVGPKNFKVIQGFINNVGKLAVKNAGKASSKLIPGVGLAVGIADACLRGFKDGDWLGATMSFISGLASMFPGIGTAASLAIDGLQIVRDYNVANEQEKESKKVNDLLRQLQSTGQYKPGDDNNIYSAILKAFGDTSYDAHKDRRKTDLINAINKLSEKAKLENYKGTEREYQEANKLLKNAGLKLQYTNKGILQSLAKGGIAKTQQVLLGDGELMDQEPGRELLIKPYSNGGKVELSGINEIQNVPIGTVVLDAKATKNVLKGKESLKSAAERFGGKGKILDIARRNQGKINSIRNAQYGEGYGDNDDNIITKYEKPKNKIAAKLSEIYDNWLRKYNIKKPEIETESSINKGSDNVSRSNYSNITDQSNYDGNPISYDSIPEPPKNSPKFNILSAVDTLNRNANSRPTGYCAKHVRLAIQSGLGKELIGRPASAKDYNTYLPRFGFKKIPFKNYEPVPGDILVEPRVPGGSIHGHITMFNGKNWVSDFVQKDLWGGSHYRAAKQGILFRHINPTDKSVQINKSGIEFNPKEGKGADNPDQSLIKPWGQPLPEYKPNEKTTSLEQKKAKNNDEKKGTKFELKLQDWNKLPDNKYVAREFNDPLTENIKKSKKLKPEESKYELKLQDWDQVEGNKYVVKGFNDPLTESIKQYGTKNEKPRYIFNASKVAPVKPSLSYDAKLGNYQLRFKRNDGKVIIYNGTGFGKDAVWRDENGVTFDSTRALNMMVSLLSKSKGRDLIKGKAKVEGPRNVYDFGNYLVKVTRDGYPFDAKKSDQILVTTKDNTYGTSIPNTGFMSLTKLLNGISNRLDVYDKVTLDKDYVDLNPKELVTLHPDESIAGETTGDKEKIIAYAMDRFVKAGLTPEQAAGIVGNLIQEGLVSMKSYSKASSYNDTHGDGRAAGKSYGIAGFNSNGDGPNLENWANENRVNSDILGGQLDYLTHLIKDNVTGYYSYRHSINGHPQGSNVGFMDAMKDLDMDDSVRSWVSKYEWCAQNTNDNSNYVKPRFSHANNALATYNKLKDNIPDMYNATGAGGGKYYQGSYTPTTEDTSDIDIVHKVTNGALDAWNAFMETSLGKALDKDFGKLFGVKADKTGITLDPQGNSIESKATGGIVGDVNEHNITSDNIDTLTHPISNDRLDSNLSPRLSIPGSIKFASPKSVITESTPIRITNFTSPRFKATPVGKLELTKVEKISDDTNGGGDVSGVFAPVNSNNNSNNTINNYYGGGGNSTEEVDKLGQRILASEALRGESNMYLSASDRINSNLI